LEMEIKEGVEKELKSLREALERAGLVVETMVKTGIPVREILRIEKEGDVSVIVIGSHGKSDLEEMFMGSVSEKVARKCEKPILIIKREIDQEKGSNMYNRILFPTDFSDVSQKALAYIKQLKACGSKEVVVLHIIDQSGLYTLDRHAADAGVFERWEKREKEQAAQSLMGIEKELKECDFKVKTLIKIGIPLREILKTEEGEETSIVVIGSHGKTNLEEIFLGSVSEKVLKRCKNPVLLVKR